MRSTFDILKPSRTDESGRARLGLLRIKDRVDLPTPNLLAVASRGFVPHLSSDILNNETNILAIHAGFEDFVEYIHKPVAHFSFPCPPAESPLKRFTTLPNSRLLVLGPRRAKPVPASGPNTYTSLNIYASVGERELEISDYLEAITKSRPDVIIAPIDIEYGRESVGLKRKDKMVERSTAWIRSFEAALKQAMHQKLLPVAWIPILPIEAELQTTYLQHLEEAGPSFIEGLVIYDSSNTVDVPLALKHLPLIGLVDPRTPQDILRLVGLGVDIIAAPFVTAAADAGIALDFDFPVRTKHRPLALGADIWPEIYATDLSPLKESCSCYTCTNHHRAYIQHLLSAKEMLAWVLLQLHNHWVVDNFFRGIRESILQGTFETDVANFTNTYQPELPEFRGQGPRIRGYQASLGAAPQKLNQSSYRKLKSDSRHQNPNTRPIIQDRKERLAEARGAESMDLDSMEDLNFAELYESDKVDGSSQLEESTNQ